MHSRRCSSMCIYILCFVQNQCHQCYMTLLYIHIYIPVHQSLRPGEFCRQGSAVRLQLLAAQVNDVIWSLAFGQAPGGRHPQKTPTKKTTGSGNCIHIVQYVHILYSMFPEQISSDDMMSFVIIFQSLSLLSKSAIHTI